MAWRIKLLQEYQAPSQSTLEGRISKGMWVPRGIAGWELYVYAPGHKKINVMAKKILFVFAIGLILFSFSKQISFATSGECSYHGGVNCGAGANAQGYAVCNDGWISSVYYSQTDECQMSCLTPDEVSSEMQTVQQETNQIIQTIQNEYTSILNSDTQTSNQAQTNCQSSASRFGFFNSGCTNSNGSGQYSIDQSKEQLAIAQAQSNADAENQKIKSEKCAVSNVITCPIGETFNGTTCICDTSRVLWNNTCISQTLYNSVNCSQTYGSNYDYSTSTNSCILKEPQCGTGYAAINGACWQIVTSTPTITSSSNDAIENTPTTSPTNTVTAPSLITKNLSLGSSGDDVSALQSFLERKDYLTLPTGTIEGYFGKITKQALIAFQKSAGLPATGYCGSMTRAAINNTQ